VDPAALDAMDRRQAERMIELIAGSRFASVCFRLIHEQDRDAEAVKFEGKLDQYWSGIEARQGSGYGAFFVINEGGDRSNQITKVRGCFIDADNRREPEEWEWHVKPDFVVRRDETHWHAYWLVSDLPVERFREVQKRLAAYYRTDRAVCDLSRVMRLAGTLHLKNPADPYTVELDETVADPGRGALNVAALLDGLPELPTPKVSSPAIAGLPLPPKEIVARLACCKPDMSYPDWRDLAGALHATPCTDAEFDKAQTFAEWSSRGGKYQSDHDCRAVYDTMLPKDGGLSAGTFIYLTNEAGYRGPTAGKNEGTAQEAFGPAVERWKAEAAREVAVRNETDPSRATDTDPARAARVARFRGRDPDEYADLPELEFWDADHILQKVPGGSVGVAYGPSGAGKTTVLLAVLTAVMCERKARVAYLAGEGGYALGKQRVPAVCEAAGITPASLRGRLRLADQVPILTSSEDIGALIEAQAPFRPDILVFDTLATALPGADENAASTGSLLTGNGPAGVIKAALGSTLIFVAHSGKDEKKGIRGTSAFAGNVDFVLRITSDKEAGTAKLYVEKMKDGPDGFSIYFKVTPGLNGVPVARRITKAEYGVLAKASMTDDRRAVGAALRKLGPGPHTTWVLVNNLLQPERDEPDEQFNRRLEAEKHRLQRLARPRKDGSLGVLAGYVMHQSSGPRDPVLWGLPGAEEDEADDD
jgi:hypothetical protein